MTTDFPYIWFWHGKPHRPIYRKGQRCRVLARGKMNSALVEFEDGFKVVTSRNALRRVRLTSFPSIEVASSEGEPHHTNAEKPPLLS